ncbi:hypothetical protein [Citrobacter meridianamericanus]|uniref:hypothetical protein n=1 Tax=Citrobacter meridianamericanus TaxID=2894201 RepID=UPI00351D1F46
MNHENDLFRQLIAYASSNGYQVFVYSFYARINIDAGFVFLSPYSIHNKVCITKHSIYRNIKAVEISVDDFRVMFVKGK